MNERDVFAESLQRLPGFVGAGVVLQNPRTPREWFVIVDDYPQAAISGDGLTAGGAAKTVLIFAAFAIPTGFLLSKLQETRQVEAEKAQFQRLGMDWAQRSR
jgi:hypothetical protein